MTTDGAFIVSGTATASGNLSVGGTASVGGGVGVLGVKNATTAPTGLPSGGFLVYGENGRPKIQSVTTGAEYIGGSYGLSPSSPVVVANTTTETNVGLVTIPASDAVVGSVYKLTAWGQASVTGTPTLQFRIFLGANLVGATANFTTSSGVTNKAWTAECNLVCLGVGSPGSWYGITNFIESVSVAGAAPTTATVRNDGGSGPITNATTSSNDFILKAKWGTASTLNTLTCRGFVVTRVA
ncbi:MAG: hypothetical protein LC723_12615 [Actinobacteria bacterium]|nr:hypothetical protein [Actinomycetota bacterium]